MVCELAERLKVIKNGLFFEPVFRWACAYIRPCFARGECFVRKKVLICPPGRLTPRSPWLVYRPNYASGKNYVNSLFWLSAKRRRRTAVGVLPAVELRGATGIGLLNLMCEFGSHQTLRTLGRISMNRTLVSGFAAFALVVGAAFAMTETTAEAGHCGGGLFARLHARHCGGGLFNGGCGGGKLFNHGCGGGLLARLRAKHASSCCAPEPACCEPAPAPCCEPAPAPCCEPAPACGGCDSGCGEVVSSCGGCSTGCGEVVSGCSGGGCGGTVVMPVEAAPAEEAASSSDAATEAAPPAPAPEA